MSKYPTKENHFFFNLSNQLNDKCLNPKKDWVLLRSFCNGRKVLLIPPILFKLESFEIRGKLFNLLEDYLSNRLQIFSKTIFLIGFKEYY